MDKVTILDNGSQYTHLIASKIRNELHVYSEIVHPDVPMSELKDSKAIILSGSPFSVHDVNAPKLNPEIFKLGKPVLGLCFGLHLMAHQLGGEVKPGKTKEYGSASLNVKRKEGVFQGLQSSERVWMSHGDSVTKLPPGFVTLGSTSDCEFAAFGDLEKKFYALQFHPEVDDTEHGTNILSNFVLRVAGCKPEWTIESFIEEESEKLRKQVGSKKVFLLVSGGVDSSVCAALLEKALGPENVIGLHVDNGLMRKSESSDVVEALREVGFKNINVVDASEDFFRVLQAKVDPEVKRKLIGTEFINVSNREASKFDLGAGWLLGQGT
ncbi:MAG: glutamine-hydrolyzing GMP synthase, partial [Candidatus Diapherotrites archaeon]|nr:glutamine-hydrolyzing GMP synthase [Candidatus Diapherotrites archaeon]